MEPKFDISCTSFPLPFVLNNKLGGSLRLEICPPRDLVYGFWLGFVFLELFFFLIYLESSFIILS